jgi:hypothetical protein
MALEPKFELTARRVLNCGLGFVETRGKRYDSKSSLHQNPENLNRDLNLIPHPNGKPVSGFIFGDFFDLV